MTGERTGLLSRACHENESGRGLKVGIALNEDDGSDAQNEAHGQDGSIVVEIDERTGVEGDEGIYGVRASRY